VKLVVTPVSQIDEEERAKHEKDAWKDFELEDREERDKMAQMNANLWGGAAAPAPRANDDSSSDDDSSDDSDSD
jgi:hypothetical protein